MAQYYSFHSKLGPHRLRSIGLTSWCGRSLMHGVAIQCAVKVACPLLGGEAGGRSAGFISMSEAGQQQERAGFGRPLSHSRFSRVGIVTAKITAIVILVLVLVLILVLVGLVLVVLVLILILVLVPLPLSCTAAADGVDPGGVR